MRKHDPFENALNPTLAEAAALLSTSEKTIRLAARVLPAAEKLPGHPRRLTPQGLFKIHFLISPAQRPDSARLRKMLAARRRLLNEQIVCDKRIQAGEPTFRGTRIQVDIVVGRLRGGEAESTLREDYPSLTANHFAAARILAGLSQETDPT